jgi:hypothetical protein
MSNSYKWIPIIAVMIILFTTKLSFAQYGNIVYVQTWEFEMPEDGSWAEFDSLATILNENVVKNNPKVLSQRIVRHFWGSNSRQLILIQEYAKIEDLVLEDDTPGKLFRVAFKTDVERQAFVKAYRKYWRGKHSDEIYREIKGARK